MKSEIRVLPDQTVVFVTSRGIIDKIWLSRL